jgi:hypothetical protein
MSNGEGSCAYRGSDDQPSESFDSAHYCEQEVNPSLKFMRPSIDAEPTLVTLAQHRAPLVAAVQ